MIDARTLEYLRELNKAMEAKKKAVDTAEQICTCACKGEENHPTLRRHSP
jgi:hypothetical protein